ncbi:MAG: 16S rRNA (uracil(1498)-N(3))-methyltransferase [Bradymonadaceae bacterium]
MAKRIAVAPEHLPDRDLSGRAYELPDRAAHYVRDVLRMSEGTELEVIDGTGRLLEGTLHRVERETVRTLVARDEESNAGESPLELTLFQAIPKGDRWKWIIQKATELGVDRIVPLETSRTVVDIAEEKIDAKRSRWRRIGRSAARQCRRVHSPDVSAPRSVASALADDSEAPALVAHPEDQPPRLARQLRGLDQTTASLSIWIGPEGGFTPDEVDTVVESGGDTVGLGPRTLRAETAAIAALTIAQEHLGDLGPSESPK